MTPTRAEADTLLCDCTAAPRQRFLVEGAKAIRWHGTAAGRPGRAALSRRGAHDREAPVQLLAGDDGRHVFLSVEPGGAGDRGSGYQERTAGQTQDHAAVIAKRVPARPARNCLGFALLRSGSTYKSAERVTNVQAPDRMKPLSVAECSPPQALRSTGSRRRARPDLLRQT